MILSSRKGRLKVAHSTLGFFNMTAAPLRSSKPSLGQIQEDQKQRASAVFLPTSISILHRWSLPRFKEIDGLSLPPWLTFTLSVFCFQNPLFIQPICSPHSYTQPAPVLHPARELSCNFTSLGGCMFLLKGFPFSDRLNSAPDFTYFSSNTVSHTTGAGSH